MATSKLASLTLPATLLASFSGLFALGCVEALTVPDEQPAAEMAVGETRRIELRYLRFDVEGFEERLTLDELRALPNSTLDELWLLDLELTPLVQNALLQLKELPADQVAELPIAAQNMRTLMNITPDNVNLEGTSLEELIALSGALGIPEAKALSDIFEIGITEDFIPIEADTQAVVEGLIASHPATQWRDGPVDAEHPDGKWAVAPNSLPITLGDVVTNFEGLTERFGPVETEWGMHPGFIQEAEGFSVIEEEFAMTVKVDINALPYKGADLTDGSGASINSTASQIATVFPVDDPDWMSVEGLVPDPKISSMTVIMLENDEFIAGGTSKDPAPEGNSPAWELPPWEFERVVVEMVALATAGVSDHCTVYEVGGADACSACIDANQWIEFETFADVGNPPAPSYAWDVVLELAQVRLHDGGLAEGEADIAFTLHDVPLGVSAEAIVDQIRANMAANPLALQDLAEALTANTVGFADFYYWKPKPGGTSANEGDWLFFIGEDDIPSDDEGVPVREYAYANPGFFADAGLTQKLSSTDDVDGDTTHEKVRVAPGDTLYVEDDAGRVYRIDVADKASPNTIALDVTRVD
ncbi:acetyltransferase [Nannocystaceae bacterium ST9]